MAARRLALRRLLQRNTVGRQEVLVSLLAEQGFQVTQTTVSRDLQAIGAQRVGGNDGPGYRVPTQTVTAEGAFRTLADIMRTFVVGFDHSANLAVVRTSPGAASPVAAALDLAALDESGQGPLADVVATIAGDDTVLVVSRAADGGAGLRQRLAAILEG